jgi:hypothetical protein
MNSERKKAVLMLSGTLIIGILIGTLADALVEKAWHSDHHRGGGRGMGSGNKKEWFTGTIYRIIEPDSAQVKQIKPITLWASQQIDSLEISSNEKLASVLDSVKKQLKPIISAEQFKRLDEFDSKARGHWRSGGRR